MPRSQRIAPAGVVFHVLNRGVGKRTIFEKDADYAAFERVLSHCLAIIPIQLYAYCLMPNHWHLEVCPTEEGQLARFMARLTMTHVRRWQEHYDQVGFGHLYQGRYKSFPIEEDNHFLTVGRYIERNALRANLVTRAEDWQWSSLWRRSSILLPNQTPIPLAEWPVERPTDWLYWINEPQTDTELQALRLSVNKGKPFGNPAWQTSITKRLHLQSSHRIAGRPILPPQIETA